VEGMPEILKINGRHGALSYSKEITRTNQNSNK